MRVFVLGSGSSGNALLVESCGTRVLVDAGIGPKVARSRLAELGVDLGPGDLHGIIATHHHGDHFGHADRLASAFGAPLYVHPGIGAPAGRHRPRRPDVDRREDVAPASGIPASGIPASGIPASGIPSSGVGSSGVGSSAPPPTSSAPFAVEVGATASHRPRRALEEPEKPIEVCRYEIGRAFRIGEITVTTVHVPHDAAQVAVRVDDGARALGVATDVGRVTSGLVSLLADCDAALVEANHCTEMLAFSDYPEVVKRRVGGGWGHLSNDQTAELAARLVGSRLARLWLGHLSQSNNTPARALEVVAARARRIDVDVLPGSTPIALDVRATKPYQLGLRF